MTPDITGTLTRAGTFQCSDEIATGFMISCTVDELAAVPCLPMYQQVCIVPAEELERLREELVTVATERNEMARRLINYCVNQPTTQPGGSPRAIINLPMEPVAREGLT